MMKFSIFQEYFKEYYGRILVDISFVFLKSYVFELILVEKKPKEFYNIIQDACSDQKLINLKSQSMKFIEF